MQTQYKQNENNKLSQWHAIKIINFSVDTYNPATWIADGCEGDYTFTRTFTVIATDACGNADTLSVDQTIEVLDQIAPQFTNTCGLANGEVLSVCCEEVGGARWVP